MGRWVWLVVLFLAGTSQVAAQAPGRVPGGQLSIVSDTQEANIRTGDVTASGNVRIEYPPRKVTATAQKAIYYKKEQKIVLTGSVVALQDQNRLDAEVVTYLIREGLFVATPSQGGRVNAKYTVSDTEERPSVPSTTSSTSQPK